MRALAIAAILLALAGCGAFRRELPPWARPVPAAASPPTAVTSEEPARIAVPPPQPPAPPSASEPAPATPPPLAVTPAPQPPVPARPVAPLPQAPAQPAVPAPAQAVPPTPPAAPSPPLTASLPPAEVRRLQDEAQRGIEETERLLRHLEGRPMAPKDLETLRLAQGLVEQARKALGGQEYERAANLAAKARTLADDLSTRR
ncbi:MAG TPA: hypothetical protein VIE44_15465 [Methylomirabilota bacterium]